MNMRTVGVVISREYMTRVKKKSFLVITFVVPLLFAALCMLPSIIMLFAKDKAQAVGYVDESGFVSAKLVNTDAVTYFPYDFVDEEQLRAKVNSGEIDAYMIIGKADSTLTVKRVYGYVAYTIGSEDAIFADSLSLYRSRLDPTIYFANKGTRRRLKKQ